MARFGCLAAFLAVSLVSGNISASAAPKANYAFVFSDSKVTYSATGAEIIPGSKFNLDALRRGLPSYDFEQVEEEEQSAWLIFRERDPDGFPRAEIEIFIDSSDASRIDFIAGWENFIDPAGATAGTALTSFFKSDQVQCYDGLDFECDSDQFDTITYSVDAETCGPDFKFPGVDTRTTLLPCLTVEGVYLFPSDRGM